MGNEMIKKKEKQKIKKFYQNTLTRNERKNETIMKEPFELKNYIMAHIHIKLTLLFLLVGLVAPGIGIGYFYLIANSFLFQFFSYYFTIYLSKSLF